MDVISMADLMKMSFPKGGNWNGWRLDPVNLVLTLPYDRDFPERGDIYEVDLERCNTSAEVLDWIMQIAWKRWASDDVLAGFIHAINDVLNPQATLCSFGKNSRIDNIRERVDEFILGDILDNIVVTVHEGEDE